MYLYLNGEVITKEEALVSVFDHGFMYGLGAFETFRTYDGFPFLIDEHLDRLHEALEELNIKTRLKTVEVIKRVQELLEKNNLKDAYFRLNVSAGTGEIGLQTIPYEKPNIILFTKPLGVMKKTEKELVSLKTVRNTPEGEKRLKSHHYLNSILGKRELKDGIRQEGVFFTKEGFVSEGTVSNLFWVTNGVLYTPDLTTGILGGITRKWVLSTSKALNIPVKTGHYTKEALLLADEVFLTNSIQEIVPVRQFEDRIFAGEEGKVTRSLQGVYDEQKYEQRTRI